MHDLLWTRQCQSTLYNVAQVDLCSEMNPQPVDVTVPLQVTNHPSQIVRTAQEDVVSWRELLSHETVLEQGVLSKDAQRGSTLFSRPLNLSSLQSKYHKSIIKHLSEMFVFWHGSIVLKLVTTLPYFVSTKIVFAYAPNGPNLDNLSPGALAGLQNSVILNPTSSAEVVLTVPFVVAGNWAPVNGASGRIIAKLLEPLVFSMDFSGGLPWTLLVSADPNDFAFRYIVPPPAEDDNADSGISSPAAGPTLSDRTLARSMSTRAEGPRVRVGSDWPLIQQPIAAPSITYETLMLVPRSRVEYVMQKVRGQFPTVEGATEFIADMFDIPTFTYSSYTPVSLPSPHSVYPYLTQIFILNAQTGTWFPHPQYKGPVQVCITAQATIMWLTVPPAAKTVFDALRPTLFIRPIPRDDPSKQLTDGVRWRFEGSHTSADNRSWHGFRVEDEHSVKFARGTYLISCAMAAWKQIDGRADYICGLLRQIDDCPPEVTHLALYTTMPPELAGTFNSWLTTSDNTAPPLEALKYSIAFSPNQSQLAFDGGRFSEPSTQKGVIWRLFKLFKGDETKWWAWLVRGLDVVVDALIGAFLGRSSVAYVVPIGDGSGFRVEAFGDYDREAISSYDGNVALEFIPQQPAETLIAGYSKTLDKRRHKLHLAFPHSDTSRTRSPPADVSGLVSRSASRTYRAKHPSSRRKWF